MHGADQEGRPGAPSGRKGMHEDPRQVRPTQTAFDGIGRRQLMPVETAPLAGIGVRQKSNEEGADRSAVRPVEGDKAGRRQDRPVSGAVVRGAATKVSRSSNA
jgi:hypothetical protein